MDRRLNQLGQPLFKYATFNIKLLLKQTTPLPRVILSAPSGKSDPNHGIYIFTGYATEIHKNNIFFREKGISNNADYLDNHHTTAHNHLM